MKYWCLLRVATHQKSCCTQHKLDIIINISCYSNISSSYINGYYYYLHCGFSSFIMLEVEKEVLWCHDYHGKTVNFGEN